MPKHGSKRTLIIIIGIAVAVLIVLSTSTYANINLVRPMEIPSIDLELTPTLNELITKIKLL